MGTNYYVVKRKPTISEPVHIGKSSLGWLFCFQIQNNTWEDTPIVWNNYSEVKEWLNKYANGKDKPYTILDEYDREISYKEFIDLVDRKQKDKNCLSNPDNFKYNKNIDGYRFTDREFS